MDKQLILTLALAATGGVAQAADTHLVPIEWTTDGAFARELTVPAIKSVEVCGKLPAGAKVAWTFDTTGPLNFNIHFHEGKKVIFPAKQDGTSKGDGTLDTTADQDYCWMWSNKAAQVATLKLKLKRAQ